MAYMILYVSNPAGGPVRPIGPYSTRTRADADAQALVRRLGGYAWTERIIAPAAVEPLRKRRPLPFRR